jgi:DNA-binding winged helix-turn-helix (wHTH) protein/Tol biopolymer transport system component
METGRKTRKGLAMTPSCDFSAASDVAGPRIYEFDDFRLDASAGFLLRGDVGVELPSRAFDALAYLIEHRDRVVGKDEIIASIWHDVAVTDDSLIHAVSVLRRKLGDDRNDPKYIKTIPRRGYRFVGATRTIATPPPIDNDVTAAPAPRAAVAASTSAGPVRKGAFPRLSWMAAAAAVAAMVVAILVSNRPELLGTDAGARAVLLSQPSPPGTRIVSGGALSPDGRYLAFVARDDTGGKTAIWLRTLTSGELRSLPGTGAATHPFWAPDSRRIGFFANGRLLTTAISTDRPRTIAAVVAPAGGAWGADDTILFADYTAGLYSVPAAGDGSVAAVAKLDHTMRDISIGWPQFLPGNRHFLYQRVNLDSGQTGVYVGNLDTLETHRLIDTESPAVFASPRHVVHVRKDMLIAEEFDPSRLELTGRAIVVARGVSAPSFGADDMVSVAGNLLAFQHRLKRQNLAWFDRTGKELSTLSMPTVLFNPRLSPDQSRLLGTGPMTSDPSLWLATLGRDEYLRLESDAIAPLWSPDGRRVAFTSRGGFDLVVRAVENPDASRLLVDDEAVKILNDWPPDRHRIVYTRLSQVSGLDLWTVDVEDAVAQPLLATPFSEMQARISPDGRWVAYSSDESGALEVYLQRYPELGDKRVVSASGGGQPQWRSDRKELFYLSADRTIMAVSIGADEEQLDLGTPRRLFRPSIGGGPEDARDHYAVSADGTRFLVDGSVHEGDDSAITVMVNWSVGARERRHESASLSDAESLLRR